MVRHVTEILSKESVVSTVRWLRKSENSCWTTTLRNELTKHNRSLLLFHFSIMIPKIIIPISFSVYTCRHLKVLTITKTFMRIVSYFLLDQVGSERTSRQDGGHQDESNLREISFIQLRSELSCNTSTLVSWEPKLTAEHCKKISVCYAERWNWKD